MIAVPQKLSARSKAEVPHAETIARFKGDDIVDDEVAVVSPSFVVTPSWISTSSCLVTIWL